MRKFRGIEPASVSGRYKIHYRCGKCRHEFWVREGEDDDRTLLMELMVK